MSLTDVDLPALKLLMRRILEARHAGDRTEAFSLFRAQLLRHIDTGEDAKRQPVRLYLDRLSRLPCGSEPWLDIFRALQRTLESHALAA
ncbi:MAG TPA: hypothetical protein VF402_03060 [Asticcacaulis sp.]